jgi:hypothetical protein
MIRFTGYAAPVVSPSRNSKSGCGRSSQAAQNAAEKHLCQTALEVQLLLLFLDRIPIMLLDE